ncbi:hypothetical protein BOTBODRAFT_27625 [Botryobasidium botryosum FD-172 SS1]|uniref:Glucose-methanol-choline oxidoreductase N-terminal domain-containing protein n=1 Tax=Botryobasidium botryosum (strain FD-172 SS1) TaxID=930990 RepID=A0A067MWT4_BOTB1|nr:hypothetical protein BOTBODRAFT_27625 [Botryobasidium botryosum FD-172 SS1]
MWPFSTPVPFPELAPSDVASPIGAAPSDANVYDYIIVGGGTAGCVLANRLTADPSIRVLLVERGHAARTWHAHVPAMNADPSRPGVPSHQWNSLPLPQPGAAVPQMTIGRALGGTSRINSMIYTRGFASEFNKWNADGRKGWSYEDLLPYFLKSEGNVDPDQTSYHGRDGPWKTKTWTSFYLKSTDMVAQAVKSLGIPIITDINAPSVPVVTGAMVTVTHNGAKRSSTSEAFLPLELALERQDRLKICTGAIVTSLDIQNTPAGSKRAVGVFIEAEKEPGERFYARAKREVVVCSGAIGSPQVLMLSGIGPKEHLKEHGITVHKDLPGVGSHLQDHMGVALLYQIPMKDSMNRMEVDGLYALWEFIKYLLFGTGFFLFPLSQIALFIHSKFLSDTADLPSTPPSPESLSSALPNNIPDIEILSVSYGQPLSTPDSPSDAPDPSISTSVSPTTPPPPALTRTSPGLLSLFTMLVQPRSTGTVRLASADPRATPLCDLAYFSDPTDYAPVRKGIKLCKRIAEGVRKSGEGYMMKEYSVPKSESDEDMDAFARKNLITAYHYSSTCRMAPEHPPAAGSGSGSDALSAAPGVVDDELRVHGVEGLRVADCSIFPNILAVHLQAPAVMVAEKCADLLLGAAPKSS